MENFIVSARKYRPDNFNTVVGQASITATLKNSIKNNHLGHAYLFSGPRGVGKTTCARIFAKTINCFNISDAGEACNHCESCESFNSNRSYNIHELDAASNNSVDDIRNLTDQVRIPPQIGSHSIYIIDEVHMLSQSAFNAFLKTLEEPPAHAIFILATTEKHKIIPTILSRCQIYDFNRIKTEDAVNYLKSIAEKENITFEEDALQIIARKADGAMRDALSIFDQVVSFSGNFISYNAVIENLNILDYDYFFKLTDFFLENDISSALMLFDDVLRKGFDARNFINGYAEHLRDLMVCKDPQTVILLEVGAGIRERYLSQSQKVDLEFLISSLDICNQADIQFRVSKNQRLTIELAMVKMARLESDQKKKSSPNDRPGQKSLKKEEQSVKQSESNGFEEENGESIPSPHEETEPHQKKVIERKDASVMPATENRIVRESSISIKDSLRGEAQEQESSSHVNNKDQNNEKGNRDGLEFPNENKLLEAWKKYAEKMKSDHPRIFSTLNSHQPEVDAKGHMKIILNTEAQKDNFIKNIKPRLIRFLANELGPFEYVIETMVESNNISDKKIYTDQDKLDYLVGKNPDLGKLKSLFNLDFDD